MVERVFDDATKLRHIKFLHSWVGGSVVERVPDKNEVHGSIPCRPTSRAKICYKNEVHAIVPSEAEGVRSSFDRLRIVDMRIYPE